MKNRICETPHGEYMIDIRDSEISRHLLEIGEYEYQEMLQWFEHLSIPSNLKKLIDIGANIGTTAIPMALDKRFVKIFSFEPDPYNYSMLDFNIKRNGLCNRIIPENIAIGDRDGCIPFELSPSNFGDHRVRYQENKTMYNHAVTQISELFKRYAGDSWCNLLLIP
jgi:FkbM family methyltransferase